MRSRTKTRPDWDRTARRAMDMLLSSTILIALAPVFGILTLLIWMEDGRPVFFRQERIGLGGRTFRIFKFRSMRTNISGSLVTASGDPRVTRVGRFIRQFKLDELAQFINVLRGEMSICGPRPEVPRYVDLEDPLWRAALAQRPGITDPASLLFRNEEELLAQSMDYERTYRETVLPEKLRVSVRYLQNRSVWSDLKLILLTARSVMLPHSLDQHRAVFVLLPGGTHAKHL